MFAEIHSSSWPVGNGSCAASAYNPSLNVRFACAMQIVLRKDVRGLGAAGETVIASAGIMRHRLYPAGLAAYATPENIAQVRCPYLLSLLACIHGRGLPRACLSYVNTRQRYVVLAFLLKITHTLCCLV